LDSLSDTIKGRVGCVVLQRVLQDEVDIVLSVSATSIRWTYLEILNLTILVILDLLIDRHPAHWLLDNLIVVGHIDSTNEVEEKVLAVHPACQY
jgi:hypothetical protein